MDASRKQVGAMTPTCPQCRKIIPPVDVNVAQNVAYCRACHRAQSLSELVRSDEAISPVHLDRPLPGVEYRRDNVNTVIGVSHRSWGTAFGTLAMALFWNGIVSVFVLVALGNTLKLLGYEGVGWGPDPKMNGKPMDWGFTLFLWVFLTPFIAIGLVLIGAFLSSLAGRTEIQIRPGQGTIFHGLGPVGWTRRFNPQAVRNVRVETGDSENNSSAIMLEMENEKPLKLVFIVAPDRRDFVVAALRQTLLVGRV